MLYLYSLVTWWCEWFPALKADHIKSVDYLSCGNPSHYQACVAKVCEAHCPVAPHQSQDDLDNLLDSVQLSAGRDPGVGRLTHTYTQLCWYKHWAISEADL